MGILVDASTRFIVQGITGREAVKLTRECLDYGSKVIGGVTPGRAGRDIYGVPVYDTVADIVARGVIKGCVESGKHPRDVIEIFRIPGAWEDEGFKILAAPETYQFVPTSFSGNADFTVRSLKGNAVLRWEYRPGSTFYLVWSRYSSVPGK